MLQLRIYILLLLFGGVFMLFLKKTYKARFVSVTSNIDYIDITHIRFFGRERYLNGTMDLKKDLGDDLYSVGIQSYNDPHGDGVYKQLPMFVPRQSICKALEISWMYLEPSLKYGINTDFPAYLRPCPIPRGKYYFKNVTAKTDEWPAIMPRGFLKGIFTFYEGKKVAGTIEAVVQITDIS